MPLATISDIKTDKVVCNQLATIVGVFDVAEMASNHAMDRSKMAEPNIGCIEIFEENHVDPPHAIIRQQVN